MLGWSSRKAIKAVSLQIYVLEVSKIREAWLEDPLSRADKAGAQIGALCRGMHQKDGETAVRRILGVLSLVKKYGGATVEDACAAALEVGVRADYHFVRRYLDRHPPLSLSLRHAATLIRQP